MYYVQVIIFATFFFLSFPAEILVCSDPGLIPEQWIFWTPRMEDKPETEYLQI
jgi:hypothetical protein